MKLKHIIFTVLCISSVSCVKQKLETTYNSQENRIDQYIEKNSTSGEETRRVVYNDGAARLIFKEGDGDELSSNGNIAFYYAGYVFTGSLNKSNLFTTNHKESAAEAGWTLTDEDSKVLTINIKEYELIPGLKNGLIGVKGGEECQILFTGKYGFGKKAFGTVPANSALIYKIWVESVSND